MKFSANLINKIYSTEGSGYFDGLAEIAPLMRNHRTGKGAEAPRKIRKQHGLRLVDPYR